jgi:hypothetical protein
MLHKMSMDYAHFRTTFARNGGISSPRSAYGTPNIVQTFGRTASMKYGEMESLPIPSQHDGPTHFKPTTRTLPPFLSSQPRKVQ